MVASLYRGSVKFLDSVVGKKKGYTKYECDEN